MVIELEDQEIVRMKACSKTALMKTYRKSIHPHRTLMDERMDLIQVQAVSLSLF